MAGNNGKEYGSPFAEIVDELKEMHAEARQAVNIKVNAKDVQDASKVIKDATKDLAGLKKAAAETKLSDAFVLQSKGFEKEISKIESRMENFYEKSYAKDIKGFDLDISNKNKGAIKQFLLDIQTLETLGKNVEDRFYSLQDVIYDIDDGGNVLGKKFSADAAAGQESVEKLTNSVRELYSSLVPSRENYNLSKALIEDTHKVTAPMRELKENFAQYEKMLASGDIKGAIKDWSEAGLRAGYAYYKSIEEAIKKGKPEENIRAYMEQGMGGLLEFSEGDIRNVTIERQAVEELLKVYAELNESATGVDRTFSGGFQNLSIKDQIAQIVEQTGLLKAYMEDGSDPKLIDAQKAHLDALNTTLRQTIDNAPKLKEIFDFEVAKFDSLQEQNGIGFVDSNIYFELTQKIRDGALSAEEAFEELRRQIETSPSQGATQEETNRLNEEAKAANDAADAQERLNNERAQSGSNAGATERNAEAEKESARAEEEKRKSTESANEAKKESAKLTKEQKELIEKETEALEDVLKTERNIAEVRAKDGDHSEQISILETRKKKQEEILHAITEEIEKVDILANNENRLLEQEKMRAKNADEINEIYAKAKDRIYGKMNSQSDTLSSIITKNDSTDKWTKEYIADIEKLKEQIKSLKDIAPTMDLDQLIGEWEKLDKEINKAIGEKSFADKRKASEVQLSKLEKQIAQIMEKNTAMGKEFKAEWENLKIKLDGAQTVAEVQRIASEINELQARMANAGRTGQRFVDMFAQRLKSLNATFLSRYLSFYDIIRYSRAAFESIRELDTSLVDLRKTAKMSSAELEGFYMSSNDVAKQMGVTTNEIIEQASSWSRLGYNTAEAASKMAELSSQFASISPGMNTEEAQTGLVSIMKAWDVSVENVKRDIMDNINTLGNNFALTNKDIIEGMERAGATLSAIGMDTKDSFALFTGAQEVIQNAEVVGTAIKTLSLRIRGRKSLPPYTVMYMLCA